MLEYSQHSKLSFSYFFILSQECEDCENLVFCFTGSLTICWNILYLNKEFNPCFKRGGSKLKRKH